MSEKDIIKWIARILSVSSVGAAVWWAGMFTATPNWKLYGIFAVVGIVDGAAGFLKGYLKCADDHSIKTL